MAKRFVSIFFIVVGIALFLVAGYFAVLFIAPGFELFGLKYISRNARKYDSGEVRILDELNKQGYDSFSGSIYVEIDECPVYVEFSQNQSNDYKVRYYENFSGLTKTDLDYPTLTFERDNLGNVIIKAQGFEKHLFENANTDRYLKISIPIVDVSNSYANRYDLKITSKNSDITFSKALNDEIISVPQFDEVILETSGKVTFDTKVYASTYSYKSNNSIIIDAECTNAVNAANYILESVNGRISITKPITGDLTATTTNYDIAFVSCEDLKAKTEHGDICCADKEGAAQVLGTVNITSKTGNIVLGKVLGLGDNSISTTSGDVTIEKIGNGTIKTTRGSVEIVSVNNMKITTNVGQVIVEEALDAINVTTTRGSVTLGGDKMTVNNPTVNSTLGKITVLSASQTVMLDSIENNVTFANTNSDNITIHSGGKLNATGLTGAVKVTADDEAYIEFADITKDSTVILTSTCKKATLRAPQDSDDNLNYALKSTKINMYRIATDGTDAVYNLGSSHIYTNNLTGNGPRLTLKGDEEGNPAQAEVFVYLRQSASE